MGVAAAPATSLKKKKLNLSLLKGMVDDDDDSSSDDNERGGDKATTTTTAASPAGDKRNGVTARDAAPRETRPRRHSGSCAEEEKKEKQAVEKKENSANSTKKKPSEKKASEMARATEKKTKSQAKHHKGEGEGASASSLLAGGLKVRSERLQLREALIQSTAKVAVVTPDEKAKTKHKEAKEPAKPKEEAQAPARKRRRTSSNEAAANEATTESATSKPEEQDAPAKRPRLTRQNSRDALKKQREADEKAALLLKEEEPADADPVRKESGKEAIAVQEEREPTVTSGAKEIEVAPTKIKGDGDESKSSLKSRKTRNLEVSGKEKAAEPEKVPNGTALTSAKVSSKHKHRSKAISDDSDSEVESSAVAVIAENGNRRREKTTPEEHSPSLANAVEAGDKRKRLKRPLSATSSNGSKSTSLADLLDREKSGTTMVATKDPYSHERREKGKGLKVDDRAKKSGRHDERHPVGSEKPNLERRRGSTSSSAHADSRNEDRRDNKHDRPTNENGNAKLRQKKKERSEATTLDDYIKERENREQSMRREQGKPMGSAAEPVNDEARTTQFRQKKKERSEAPTLCIKERGNREQSMRREDDKPTGIDVEPVHAEAHLTHASAQSTAVPGDKKQSALDEEKRVKEAKATGEAEADNERDGSKSVSVKESSDDTALKEATSSTDAAAADPSSRDGISVSPAAANFSKASEDDEDGAVSHDEISAEDKTTTVTGADAAPLSDPAGTQEQADPMSFVIPKKRPVAAVMAHSSPKTAHPVVPAPRQPRSREVTTPGPPPSPVSSVEMNFAAPIGKQRPRSKNAVPPKMTPLSSQEKDFFGLAKKSNSLLKAASVLTARRSSAVPPQLMSPFGCTSDRYGVILESGKIYTESTTRMTCPTRKQIKNSEHPPAFFGVAMEAPPDVVTQNLSGQSAEREVKLPSTVSCYETLEFAKAEDRDWFLKRMYGTTFVPQLLRERVTLVMRNARYVRKSTGLLFNAQRDKEEYAAQIAERYKVNRSVPRCDILQKNWQLLVNGRVTFVFLHYMNREDALIARAQFRDDDGLPLIIKGETSRANEHAVNTTGRIGMSPALSPPPVPSPQPRHRSRSRSNGRSPPRRADHPEQGGRDAGGDQPSLRRWQGDDGPKLPRDRSAERGRKRRRRGGAGKGSDARNGGRYGPQGPSRSPPRHTSRSRSPHRQSEDGDTGRRTSPQSSKREPAADVSVHGSQESENRDKRSEPAFSSQSTLGSSQTATQDGSVATMEEGSSQGMGHSNGRRMSIGGRDGDQPRRVRSRSRSRPRVPDDRPPPMPHPGRRGSEDRSFQRDRRSSGEYYGRGRDDRRGQSPSAFSQYPERDRHGRDFDRYGQHDQHQHHHHPPYDGRAPPPREHDHRGHFEGDPYRRQHPRDDRRYH